MTTLYTRRRRLAPLVGATAAIAMLTVAAPPVHAQVIPPAVPANLEVAAGNTAYLVGHADGTQDYICLLSRGGFEWTFFGPQATLFDDNGRQVITHFLSANPDEAGRPRARWQQAQDSSSVWAVAVENSTDSTFVAVDAIAWLLLRVVGAEDGPLSGDALSGTTFIQRVNTSGGLAPTAGCGQSADVGRKALVPYTADYVFYRP